MCMKFGSDPRADFLGKTPVPGLSAEDEQRRLRLPADIALAANRLAGHVRQTPLEWSAWLSEATGADVWLKLENQQLTGSFKLRGAFNKLLCLSDEDRARGCVTASSGNHGAAVAWALHQLGVEGLIFVPEHTSGAKVDAIRRAGATLEFFGTDGLDTEAHARQYAVEHDLCYVSPYNDWDVIAGQGSCGVEIARQLPDVDAVVVAVGGGGLVSGIGSFLKSAQPGVCLVSAQPAASAVMTESVRAGRILDLPSERTLSDGTAGGIEADAVTFALCQAVVDRYVTVDEAAIAAAMRDFISAQHQLIEGAAGVAVAALLEVAPDVRGQRIVVVICGGNVSLDTLRSVI